MTKIDFYVLKKEDLADRSLYACRLIDKVTKLGHRVMVATDDAQQSEQFDQLLWEFRPESFVPHAIAGSDGASLAPVLISHELDDNGHHDVLVNLSLQVPPFFSRFQRLAEIVVQHESVLNICRENYSFYKSRGYPVNYLKLG
ncbi:DNA polymerase III subunit chi [Teredinibacter waterburyi]|uniref:DNA polymerase III subunit chi n=1 Tax=Teredinibacter waterburyi TaxID=1500538 RepID=UPI00165FBDB3|nr:DNA polymerase III subunit chi [Teredinibacter waterburyi]